MPAEQSSSGTREIIAPILREAYGTGHMVESLADYLARRIDAYPKTMQHRSREDVVMKTCWDWFPGGDTAASVGAKIETALDAFESGAFL